MPNRPTNRRTKLRLTVVVVDRDCENDYRTATAEVEVYQAAVFYARFLSNYINDNNSDTDNY